MPLAIGEAVGDFVFRTPTGDEVRLSSFRGRPILLVFLRHLA